MSTAKAKRDLPIGLFDMDGILADLLLEVQATYFNETGKTFDPQTLKSFDLDSQLPGFRELKYWTRPGIFKNLAPIKGAIEAMTELDSLVNIYILSAPTKNGGSVPEKAEWLAKYLPFIHRRRYIFTPAKWLVRGDLFVDDHANNLVEWKRANPQGLTYGLRYGYNATHPTVYPTWAELLPAIKAGLESLK